VEQERADMHRLSVRPIGVRSKPNTYKLAISREKGLADTPVTPATPEARRVGSSSGRFTILKAQTILSQSCGAAAEPAIIDSAVSSFTGDRADPHRAVG
jgi:hypothetical protein